MRRGCPHSSGSSFCANTIKGEELNFRLFYLLSVDLGSSAGDAGGGEEPGMLHGGSLGKQKVCGCLEIILFAVKAGEALGRIFLTACAELPGHKCQTFLK